MQRRRFLAVAGATLGAGCSGLFPTRSEEPTGSVTPVPVESVTETPRQSSGGDDQQEAQDRPSPVIGGVQVVELETGPRTVSIPGESNGVMGLGESDDTTRLGESTDDAANHVSLSTPDGGKVHLGFTATATPDHPATVLATLVNENDWPHRFVLDDVPAFVGANYARRHHSEFSRRFDAGTADDRESTLYLVPTARHQLADDEPTVERGPEGYWRLNSSPPELPDAVTLAGGDFVAGEYYVLGRSNRVGMPTGTYEFSVGNGGLTLVAWDTATPGPTSPSRFVESVESLPTDEDTPWFHDADSTTALFLQPERERIGLPGRIAFRLVNHSRNHLSGNPFFWELYKRVDGEWYEVVPRGVAMPVATITPGETHGYSLSLFHGSGLESDDEHADLGVSIDRLGGGRYAFASGFSERSGITDAPAAMFDVDAPPIRLSIPDNATQYQVGDHAVVTLSEWGDVDTQDATLTLHRVGATVGTTVVRETVARDSMRALESALAVVDGTDTVLVRATGRLVRNVTGDAAHRWFTFEGTSYLAVAEFED